MFDIIFPQNSLQRYWDIHYKYLLKLFDYLDCHISFQCRDDLIVTVDKKDFLFDFSGNIETFLPAEAMVDRIFKPV